MVIGAPHIDDLIVATCKFVQMVSDIRSKIGELPVLTAHHTVFFVAEGGGTKPQRAIFFIQMAVALQGLHCARHFAAVVERMFGKPAVITHAELRQIVALIGEHGVQRKLVYYPPAFAERGFGACHQRVERCIGVFAFRGCRGRKFALQLRAVLRIERARDVAHIIAAITVGGKRHHRAARFEITQPHRGGEYIHLPARVVDVKLARDFMAGSFQHIGDTRAVCRAPPVTDVQRPGGIGRDELDLDFLFVTAGAFAEIRTYYKYLIYNGFFVSAVEEQIDKSSARNFRFFQQRRRRQRRHQFLRNVARLGAQRFRKLHRHIAGEITVLNLLGAFERDDGAGGFRRGGFERGRQQIDDRGLHVQGVGGGCDAHALRLCRAQPCETKSPLKTNNFIMLSTVPKDRRQATSARHSRAFR